MKRFVVVAALSAAVAVLVMQAQAATVKGAKPNAQAPLRLSIVGPPKCSLKAGALHSFRFKVTGAKPGDQVMILPFYPEGYVDPVFTSNKGGYYWYQDNFGTYTVPASGVVMGKPWDCRYGPRGTKDPAGGYSATVVNLSTAPRVVWQVTK